MKQDKNIPSLADYPIPDTSLYEWQVIHDVVLNNDNMPGVIEMIRPEMFTNPLAKRVWEKAVGLYNDGKTYDIVAIGVLDTEVAQQIYAPRLTDSGILDARQHAQVLRDMSARRRCYIAGLDLIKVALTPSNETDVYGAVSETTAKVQEGEMHGEKPIGIILNEIAENAEKRRADIQAGRLNRVTTGFSVLDRFFFGGFAPGNLVIIAARPSVGKTALMLQFARVAAKNRFWTVLFSLEMTEEELGNRMLFATGKVDPYALANGELDWPKFEEANNEIGGLPLLVNDHTRNLQEIVSRMTILHNAGKLDIAFIDYVGLIEAQMDGRTPLTQVIAHITGTMKMTAKRLGIPVVLLCQLNRDVAKGANEKHPQLVHLRDSGSIEQDADIGIMLQQEPAPGEDMPNLLAWVRKNRQGKKDFALVLRPNDTYTQFDEISVRE